MKRILAVVLLIFTLASCSKREAVEPKLSDISFVAEISYYNEVYSCDCVINSEKELTAVIKIPETLEGFTLKVGKDGVTAEYLGIKYTPTDGNMPFSSVIKQIYDRLCLVSESQEIKREDKTYKISAGEGAEKTVLSLTESGFPILLSLPDERFYVEFYNVSALNK